ncbi:nSTAND1 domain-containing NTPase [Micromonospora sp. CPCC 205558]|uniref:nSTAND1 domain-containing NTPase n=1 Tax=Micromonospora sp. CPCC 205558 TaxID=3122403 RepID=UPI003FA5AF33
MRDDDRARPNRQHDREARDVLHRLERPGSAAATRIVAIVGPSGVGKSSLIRAGVIARLFLDIAGSRWDLLRSS